MSETIYTSKIQFKRDTTDNWDANKSRVLSQGEPAVEYKDDAIFFKIGDGETSWEKLPYLCDTNSSIFQKKNLIINGEGYTLDWKLNGQYYTTTVATYVKPTSVRLSYVSTNYSFDETVNESTGYEYTSINFNDYGFSISILKSIYNSSEFKVKELGYTGNINSIIKSDGNGFKAAVPNVDYMPPFALDEYCKLSGDDTLEISRGSSKISISDGTIQINSPIFKWGQRFVATQDWVEEVQENLDTFERKFNVSGVLKSNGSGNISAVGVDTKATQNSNNLITSGAVSNEVSDIMSYFSSQVIDNLIRIVNIDNKLKVYGVLFGDGEGNISPAQFDTIPTQNSNNLVTSGVIYSELSSIKNDIDDDDSQIQSISSDLSTFKNKFNVNGVLKSNGSGNISAISIDTVPTLNSSNLINSGAVYTSINNLQTEINSSDSEIQGLSTSVSTLTSQIETLQNKLKVNGILKGDGSGNITSATFDSVPTSGSNNLISSGTLYNILGDIQSALESIYAALGGPVNE